MGDYICRNGEEMHVGDVSYEGEVGMAATLGKLVFYDMVACVFKVMVKSIMVTEERGLLPGG